MRTLWLMYKTESKLSLREFSGILFAVLIPVGLIILLGIIDGDGGTAEQYAISQFDLSFGAVSILGISSVGLMTLPLSLSDYRQRKILKRYQVTPISPTIMLLSHLLFCFSLSIVSTVLVYLVSALMFGFSFQGSLLGFIGIYLLVTVSVHAIGMIVASLAPNAQMAGVIASLIYFPMIFLSGATIPYEVMPAALQAIANFLPLTHGINLLQAASLGQPLSDFQFSFWVIVLVFVIGMIVSIKAFRWE